MSRGALEDPISHIRLALLVAVAFAARSTAPPLAAFHDLLNGHTDRRRSSTHHARDVLVGIVDREGNIRRRLLNQTSRASAVGVTACLSLARNTVSVL